MRFDFFVSEAAKSTRVNLLMSLTAATTTFVCILILGVSLVIAAHVRGVIGSVEEDVGVSAFFPLEATSEDVERITREAGSFPEVREADSVSEVEAVEEFRRDYREQPEIYAGVETGDLPASLELKLNDSADAGAVAVKLEERGFLPEDIRYPQRTINQLNEIAGYIVWGLRGATALFLVSSVLLISNAIRLSIFARRDEIEVMKLVGATDGFVRTPFLIEGLAQGVVGAFVAAGAVIWLNHLFVGWAGDNLPLILPISSEAVNAPLMLLVLVGVGAAIGVAGSFVSVRRFLKV